MRHTVCPGVAHESIDGEVVAIHFRSGRYYSFRGAAATIWEAIRDGGASAGEAVLAVRTRYRDCPPDAEAEVERVFEMLAREQLIAPVHGQGGHDAATAVPVPAPAQAQGQATPALARAWEPPLVEKYADLDDLLALDPIHDANDQGWPASTLAAPRPAAGPATSGAAASGAP